jgi:hypothetical protein
MVVVNKGKGIRFGAFLREGNEGGEIGSGVIIVVTWETLA